MWNQSIFRENGILILFFGKVAVEERHCYVLFCSALKLRCRCLMIEKLTFKKRSWNYCRKTGIFDEFSCQTMKYSEKVWWRKETTYTQLSLFIHFLFFYFYLFVCYHTNTESNFKNCSKWFTSITDVYCPFQLIYLLNNYVAFGINL